MCGCAALSCSAGYALGRGLNDAAPCLRSLDFGMPAPFAKEVASAIVSVRTSLKLSYYGLGRLLGDNISLGHKRLTTSDVTLITTSLTRNVTNTIKSFDFSFNKIDNDGVRRRTALAAHSAT